MTTNLQVDNQNGHSTANQSANHFPKKYIVRKEFFGYPYIELEIEPKFLKRIYLDECSEGYINHEIVVHTDQESIFFNYYAMEGYIFRDQDNAETFIKGYRHIVNNHISKDQENFDIHCNNLLLFSHIIDLEFIALIKKNPHFIAHDILLKAYELIESKKSAVDFNIEIYISDKKNPYRLSYRNEKKQLVMKYQNRNLIQDLIHSKKM